MSSRICRSCKSEVPEGSRFCPNCGKEIGVLVCPACGARAPEDARFCPKCGREISSQTTPPQAAVTPVPPPPIPEPKQPVPAAPGQQQPKSPPRKTLRTCLTIFIVLLVILVAIIIIVAFWDRSGQDKTPVEVPVPETTPQPEVTTVTLEENNALWTKANTALAAFVGDNLALFSNIGTTTITPEIKNRVTQQVSDFDQALKALEAVEPPPDQVIVQETLLPLYRGICEQMVVVKDTLGSGDPLKIDLEVQRLALLLNELGGAADTMTLETPPEESATTSTTTTTPQVTVTTPGVPALPPAIQVQESKVLFSDDFSNPQSGWVTSLTEGGDISYENGEYSLLVKKSQWYIVGWNRSMGSQTDFAVEVQGKLLSSGNDAEYGLVFRRESPEGDSNFYLFTIKNGSYRMQKYYQGEWSTIQSWEASSDIAAGQSINRLKLVCQGKQIDLYANGQRLTSIIDASITSGYIGLEAAELGTQVHFDNFKLYAVSGSS
jgi:RNA polymerase subunit RPABC4/transcription elongation factor Spt4